jgi:hypothetical protein
MTGWEGRGLGRGVDKWWNRWMGGWMDGQTPRWLIPGFFPTACCKMPRGGEFLREAGFMPGRSTVLKIHRPATPWHWPAGIGLVASAHPANPQLLCIDVRSCSVPALRSHSELPHASTRLLKKGQWLTPAATGASRTVGLRGRVGPGLWCLVQGCARCDLKAKDQDHGPFAPPPAWIPWIPWSSEPTPFRKKSSDAARDKGRTRLFCVVLSALWVRICLTFNQPWRSGIYLPLLCMGVVRPEREGGCRSHTAGSPTASLNILN